MYPKVWSILFDRDIRLWETFIIGDNWINSEKQVLGNFVYNNKEEKKV